MPKHTVTLSELELATIRNALIYFIDNNQDMKNDRLAGPIVYRPAIATLATLPHSFYNDITRGMK